MRTPMILRGDVLSSLASFRSTGGGRGRWERTCTPSALRFMRQVKAVKVHGRKRKALSINWGSAVLRLGVASELRQVELDTTCSKGNSS